MVWRIQICSIRPCLYYHRWIFTITPFQKKMRYVNKQTSVGENYRIRIYSSDKLKYFYNMRRRCLEKFWIKILAKYSMCVVYALLINFLMTKENYCNKQWQMKENAIWANIDIYSYRYMYSVFASQFYFALWHCPNDQIDQIRIGAQTITKRLGVSTLTCCE